MLQLQHGAKIFIGSRNDMITKEMLLMGREKEYPLNAGQLVNLIKLQEMINNVENLYGFPLKISSGYRPGRFNVAAGGSKASAHLTCEAVDIQDTKGVFKAWCLKNIQVLTKMGVFMEDPTKTPTWCHLQTRKTKGNPFKV